MVQCFSDACKARSGAIVLCISVLIGILGIITIALGGLLSGFGSEQIDKLGELAANAQAMLPNLKVVGIVILIGGAVVLLTGICGCLAAKKKTFVFTLPFMICTGLMAIMLLVVAFFALGNTAADKITDEVCKKWEETQQHTDMWKLYSDNFGKVMCTQVCPCDAAVVNTLKEDKYKDMIKRSTGIDQNSFVSRDGFKANATTQVNGVKDCLAKMEAVTQNKDTANIDKIKSFLNSKAYNFTAMMEDKYKCSMICKPGIFQLSKPLTTDIPDNGCFRAFVDELAAKGKNAGIVALVTALLCIIAFICSFPLCSGFSSKQEGAE